MSTPCITQWTTEHESRRRTLPPGSWEQRDHLAGFLRDSARELADRAPLSAMIARAYHCFQQAGIPEERRGDYLYEARAITQEHSGQIETKVPTSDSALSFAPKPKMAYFFAVLRDLLGLKDDPDRPERDSRAGFVSEDKRSSFPTRRAPVSESDRFEYTP